MNNIQENTLTEINIDIDKSFFNPFNDESNIESMILYENYMRHTSNKGLIQMISDKKIISEEDETKGWTRSEILRKIACSYGFRKDLTMVNRDILSIPFGIICHQVNCQGAMGAGLAKKIRNKYPKVYEFYKDKQKILGTYQLIKVNDDHKYPLYVCNIFGQDDYKRKFNIKHLFKNDPYTVYSAVKKAFKRLKAANIKLNDYPLPIYVPYNMGCNLAGGNWEKYSSIIKSQIPDVVICKFE